METDPKDQKEVDDKSPKHSMMAYMALSQFAYTLVIVTCIFGWIGHLIGEHLLGGSPWDFILMLILGGLGMGLEMWRMIRKASSMINQNQKKDEDEQS